MRAGSLDRVIEIQRMARGVPDLYGAPVFEWITFATMRAQLLQNATDDREGAGGKATDAVLTFRTRWIDGVTLEHRILYQGTQFTITRISEIGRRVGKDLTGERVGP